MIDVADIDVERERAQLAEAERRLAAAVERLDGVVDPIERGRVQIEICLRPELVSAPPAGLNRRTWVDLMNASVIPSSGGVAIRANRTEVSPVAGDDRQQPDELHRRRREYRGGD